MHSTTKLRPGRVSSFDVARAAGVSRSAVSRTFTDGASVSPETRAKVIEAAKALGYKPNAIARTLTSRESRIVAVVMAEVTNPFYARVLDELSHLLQERGLTLLLFTAPDAHLIDTLIPTLLAYQVDGVVIASATLSSSLARRCREAGTPVVLFNRYTQSGQINAVACDNVAGGKLAAKLLLETKPKRIGFIAGIEDTSSSQDRERGFMEEFASNTEISVVRAVGQYTYQGGREAARKLLHPPQRPDALFCANDMMALGAIDVARGEFGLRVPEDLSVIGFDDIPAAALAAYTLTTVVQDVEAMARETIDLLLASRANPDLPPQKRLIPCRVALRQSVRGMAP